MTAECLLIASSERLKVETAIQMFKFEDKQEIRVVQGEDGEPWVVARDVCEVLGLANVGQAISRLDSDEKNTISLNDGTPGARIAAGADGERDRARRDRRVCQERTGRRGHAQQYEATVSRDFFPPLDEGIAAAVVILCDAGIETYESCEGGPGHSYAEPAVRFHGDKSEGFKALDVALKNGLPVSGLRRFWTIEDLEPTGPKWEMVFYKKMEPISQRR